MSQEEELDDFGDYITSLLGDTGVTQLTKRKRRCTKTEEEKKAKRQLYNRTMRDKLKANNSIAKATILDDLDTLIEWCQNPEREEMNHEDMERIFKDIKVYVESLRFPY